MGYPDLPTPLKYTMTLIINLSIPTGPNQFLYLLRAEVQLGPSTWRSFNVVHEVKIYDDVPSHITAAQAERLLNHS